jgi:hypothetical protein
MTCAPFALVIEMATRASDLRRLRPWMVTDPVMLCGQCMVLCSMSAQVLRTEGMRPFAFFVGN